MEILSKYGNVKVEISGNSSVFWGNILGMLSNQTDLQNALNAKQDTLTLTTTGTSGAATLVGATLNIPQYSGGGASGITIGTTAITLGTVGRVLFEGTGNVVQESANLFWDNTNGRLGIGTSTPLNTLDVAGTVRLLSGGSYLTLNGATFSELGYSTNNLFRVNGAAAIIHGPQINFLRAGSEIARFAPTTGNFLINTTTDAGYKLDVNGTARVKGTGTADANSFVVQNSAAVQTFRVNDLGQVQIGRTTAINWTFSSNTLSCTQYAFILSSNGSALSTSGNGGVLGNDTGAKICDQALGALNQVASAVLECNSTTRGFLPPRMSNAQMLAIATPATSLMVYDTTNNKLCCYDGATWQNLF